MIPIIPIPKKPNPAYPNGFHPMALTPIVMKRFGQLVMQYIKCSNFNHTINWKIATLMPQSSSKTSAQPSISSLSFTECILASLPGLGTARPMNRNNWATYWVVSTLVENQFCPPQTSRYQWKAEKWKSKENDLAPPKSTSDSSSEKTIKMYN